MPTESIELSRFLPATPDRIYLAWLSGADHSAMTGGEATVASLEVGGAFTAWDGYIDGVHLALEPGRRIVQAWRTDDFPADAPESHLEILLEPERGGTRFTLRHTEIPAGQGPSYLEGWDEHYLAPMERFFLAEARRRKGWAGEAGAAGRKGVQATGARKAGGKRAATPGSAGARSGPAKGGSRGPAGAGSAARTTASREKSKRAEPRRKPPKREPARRTARTRSAAGRRAAPTSKARKPRR